MTWNLVHSTTFAGPVAAVGAGQTLYDGWIDLTGNVWDINSSNFAESGSASGSPWNNALLVRPSGEDEVDSQIIATFVYHSTGRDIWLMSRSNRSTSNTCYMASVDNGNGLQIFKVVAGSITTLYSAGTNPGLTDGTQYTSTFQTVQTNGTTTTLTLTISTTGGTQLLTHSITDTTSQLQNIAGSNGFFVYSAAQPKTSDVASVATYTDVAGAATAYTLTGPSSGLTGAASSNFTVTTNGVTGSTIIVTPSDSAAGGTFTPSTVSLAAGTNSSGTFTYTPSSNGAKTISTTNNGSLTNPSSLTYTAYSAVNVAVNNAAFKFSPGNWKGDTGRGGSVYRQSWNNGAWFIFNWNASASPTAKILLPTSSTGCMLSYFLNGVLVDNIAATASITLSNIVPSAANTLVCYLRNSPQTSRWNNGTNVIQIQGMQIDNSSSAGTAPAPLPWVLILGDSITEGIEANAAADDNLMDYSFLMGQALLQLGYDYTVSACGYSGWLRPGDSGGDVPAFYSVSGSSGGAGGTYSDSASRWNKIDNGVSLLDSASKISSYGATGTAPAAIFINYMTNEALSGSNSSDAQASVTQAITALRAAAPNALIVIQVPFGLYNSTVYTSSATYLSALKNGVAAYKTANPNDGNVILSDFGPVFSATSTHAPYINTEGVHPLAPGHALIAPLTTEVVVSGLKQAAARYTHF